MEILVYVAVVCLLIIDCFVRNLVIDYNFIPLLKFCTALCIARHLYMFSSGQVFIQQEGPWFHEDL